MIDATVDAMVDAMVDALSSVGNIFDKKRYSTPILLVT